MVEDEGNERHERAAGTLAGELVTDAVGAAATLGKELRLRRSSPQETATFREVLAVRVASAELAFEVDGAAFQRITGPALLRRHLGVELTKPSRVATTRRRLLQAVLRQPMDELHALLDRRLDELRPLPSPAAVVDHHCRTLMAVTGHGMAEAPLTWMTVRAAELRAVEAAQAAVGGLLSQGWFDPDPL